MIWAWIAFAVAAIVCIATLPRYRPAIVAFLVLVSVTEIYRWYARPTVDDAPSRTAAPAQKQQLRYASRTAIRRSDVQIDTLAVKPVFGKLYLVTAHVRNGSRHPVGRLALKVKVYHCRRGTEGFGACVFLESQTARFDSDTPLIAAGGTRSVQANIYLDTAPRDPSRLKFSPEISQIEAAVPGAASR